MRETQGSGLSHREIAVVWRPFSEALGPRRAREPAKITAYVPGPIAELGLALPDDVVQAVIEAEGLVASTQQHADTIGVGTVAQQLLRSEAVASSQMEGVPVPGHRALATALVADQHRPGARAAAANIDAAQWIYEWAWRSDEPLTIEILCEIHRRLAQADDLLAAQAGAIRDRQNWIGSDPYSPVGADFIPPPAAEVRGLLEDLCQYASRRDVPALVQAAVIHAQFETIHPFGDGNGRVGRCLIGAILARRGICREVIPPVSLALARDGRGYVASLTAWRYESDGAERWIAHLARATADAAFGANRLATDVALLQAQWLEQAGRPRRDSAAAAIIQLLPAYPVLSGERAAAVLERSSAAARAALNALEAAGVLRRITVGRRNRMWECVGLFALLDDMERSLSGGERGGASSR